MIQEWYNKMHDQWWETGRCGFWMTVDEKGIVHVDHIPVDELKKILSDFEKGVPIPENAHIHPKP